MVDSAIMVSDGTQLCMMGHRKNTQAFGEGAAIGVWKKQREVLGRAIRVQTHTPKWEQFLYEANIG